MRTMNILATVVVVAADAAVEVLIYP